MGEKKEKNPNKTKCQDRAKLKEDQKRCRVEGVNRIPEGMVSGISEGWGSSILQSKVIDFPLGEASSSLKRLLLWSPGISWP